MLHTHVRPRSRIQHVCIFSLALTHACSGSGATQPRASSATTTVPAPVLSGCLLLSAGTCLHLVCGAQYRERTEVVAGITDFERTLERVAGADSADAAAPLSQPSPSPARSAARGGVGSSAPPPARTTDGAAVGGAGEGTASELLQTLQQRLPSRYVCGSSLSTTCLLLSLSHSLGRIGLASTSLSSCYENPGKSKKPPPKRNWTTSNAEWYLLAIDSVLNQLCSTLSSHPTSSLLCFLHFILSTRTHLTHISTIKDVNTRRARLALNATAWSGDGGS